MRAAKAPHQCRAKSRTCHVCELAAIESRSEFASQQVENINRVLPTLNGQERMAALTSGLTWAGRALDADAEATLYIATHAAPIAIDLNYRAPRMTA